MKTFDLQELPKFIQERFMEEGYHNCSFTIYYPCDGYFKSLEEFKNIENKIDEREGFAYEKGDDKVSDWFLDNGSESCEEILIKIAW